MSALYLRRAVRRAHMRASEADWNTVSDAGMASPMIRPLDLSKCNASTLDPDLPMLKSPEAEIPLPSHETSAAIQPEAARCTKCPITYAHECPGHETEPATVFFYANQFPSQEQSGMLAEKCCGYFFEGGNPPPSIWAAFYRVMNGEKDPVYSHMLYAYCFHHCPDYRDGLLKARQGRLDEKELLEEVDQFSLDHDADIQMGGISPMDF